MNDRFDEKLDKMLQSQGRLSEKLTRISLLVAQNTDDLKEHMKRTEVNEKRLEELEKLKYYIFSAVVTAALLSSPLQSIAVKLLALFK